jgi:NAD(P)-dependent dehydrogenase (short-subunit alcohol dehydrogenase family)
VYASLVKHYRRSLKPQRSKHEISMESRMSRLSGKVALITGGNSGIGLATAKLFIKEGAFVYITGRKEATLAEASKLLGEQSQSIKVDVSNLGDISRMYDVIAERHQQLDIVVANAGGGEFSALGEYTEDHYSRTFDANVKGLIFTVQGALPSLHSGSSVVLVGSQISIEGVANFGIYAATKAAVRSLARTWTAELSDRNIRVNVVSPGPTDTPAISGLVDRDPTRDAELRKLLASSVPLKRMGTADESANVILFLASDESSFVAGADYVVDGGKTGV